MPVQEPAPERYAREPGLAQVREPVQALAQGPAPAQGPVREPVQAWQSAADSG